VPPGQPVLQLGEGTFDSLLFGGSTTEVRVGGQPGDTAFLVASPELGPSVAPGIVALDIGLGFSSLFFLGAQTIEPKAWTQFDLPVPHVPSPLLLYLQAVELDAAGLALPAEVTNTVQCHISP